MHSCRNMRLVCLRQQRGETTPATRSNPGALISSIFPLQPGNESAGEHKHASVYTAQSPSCHISKSLLGKMRKKQIYRRRGRYSTQIFGAVRYRRRPAPTDPNRSSNTASELLDDEYVCTSCLTQTPEISHVYI